MSDIPHTQDIQPSSPTEASPSPLGASWQEQDALLRDLWMQNKTPQQISEVLGRSVPAIMTRAVRLGLPRRAAPGRKPGVGTLVRPAPPPPAGGTHDRRAWPPAEAFGVSAPAKPQPSLRVCLMCLRKFESMGRHNRICLPCKGSAEYSLASALPDVQLPQS